MGRSSGKPLQNLCFLLLLGASVARVSRKQMLSGMMPTKSPMTSPTPQVEDRDAPIGADLDRCPEPMMETSSEACQELGCQEDSDCKKSHLCCFNGCVFTCLPEVLPPPYFDQQEPKMFGGNHDGLVDMSKEMSQAQEECLSVQRPGMEPLRCPPGFDCIIVRRGNISRRIPYILDCVRHHKQTEDHPEEVNQ